MDTCKIFGSLWFSWTFLYATTLTEDFDIDIGHLQNCYFQLTTCRDVVVAAAVVVVDGGILVNDWFNSIEMFLLIVFFVVKLFT